MKTLRTNSALQIAVVIGFTLVIAFSAVVAPVIAMFVTIVGVLFGSAAIMSRSHIRDGDMPEVEPLARVTHLRTTIAVPEVEPTSTTPIGILV